MTEREALARSVGAIARQAAAELEALSAGDGLSGDTKTARDLCAVLKDMLTLEKELREQESAAVLTVRFEGDAAEAAR